MDSLIDQGRSHLEKKKRIEIFQKVYHLIAEDVPYIFMFHSRWKFYGVNKGISTPADAFEYDMGISHWSLNSSP